MTKERLFRILNIFDCFNNYGYDRQIGYIINNILPAVRDNEEFKKDFWEWWLKYIYNNNHLFNVGYTNVNDIPEEQIEGYKLRFIREILKPEGKE